MNKIEYIKNLSDFIYDNVDKISYGIKDINSIYRFYSSFAISKAENSKLTIKDALLIQNKTKIEDEFFLEIKEKVSKLSKAKKNYKKELQLLHDKLEYYNISKTLDYIRDSDIGEIIKKNGISNEIILDIHKRLTIGLDELFLDKLEGYDPYFSGNFRKENNIKVGNKKVMDFNLISEKLEKIYELTKNISNLDDVFFLHANLYYIHPFSNGNKRICRILEEIYIANLGIETSISASHGYYLHQRLYIKQIYQKTIRKQLFESFADFGYSSLIISGLYMLHNQLSSIKREILRPYNLEIFKNFVDGETLKTKDLEKEITKKLKISSRTFFLKLANEKEKLGDIIKEEKIGRNVFYSLNLTDKKYLKIKNKIYELGAEYKKYNIAYSEINFLKNYKF